MLGNMPERARPVLCPVYDFVVDDAINGAVVIVIFEGGHGTIKFAGAVVYRLTCRGCRLCLVRCIALCRGNGEQKIQIMIALVHHPPGCLKKITKTSLVCYRY